MSDFKTLLKDVASIASNSSVQSKLKSRGLCATSVAWDDTSRYKNSCGGSNISDLTLKVDSTRMPIIRAPNFTDTTVDLTSDKLPMLVVGNECGGSLSKVTLGEYLKNFSKYCGESSSGPVNLYCDRDSHVLTSAQACVLPVDNGKVEFAVDLYNYQSELEPAVLVVMATAYGTSAQVVSGGNTMLYFNGNGTNMLFRAERLTDHRISQGRSASGTMTSEEKSLNGIYIFQVPLKVKFTHSYFKSMACFGGDDDDTMIKCCAMPKYRGLSKEVANSRGMERAILTVGEEKGAFKGIKKSDGGVHELVRDSERPIRLTVQFYMCTDTVQMSDSNLAEICDQIRHIYDQGLSEGSLVVDHAPPKPGLPTSVQPARPTATTTTTTTTTTASEYKPSYLISGML